MIRVDGDLQPTEFDRVTPHDGQRLIYDVLTDPQIERFEKSKELDFSYGVPKMARFRFNIYRQRGSVGAAMRTIPSEIPKLQDISLPPALAEFTNHASGLVLVTGPTGSGKSTTQASLIDIINETRPVHIMTIEDPIEYLHRHKVAMVNQRELGADTDSFGNALRAVLREDPDVVLVGEMRDLETIRAALTIAETGHLVFATLHTRNAPQTIDRIVDVFPPHEQEQIRVLLANTLEAVIAQQLLPRLGSAGRVPAVELMVATAAIKALVREAKTAQILGQMQTGREHGMVTMDSALSELVIRGEISREDAYTHCMDRPSLDQHLARFAY
jgi:twitching motility protein PilT